MRAVRGRAVLATTVGVGALLALGSGRAMAWNCQSECSFYRVDCHAYVAACTAAEEICTAAAQTASLQVRIWNGPGESLTDRQRDLLRDFFGDLVDRVTVHYGAFLAGEVPIGGRSLRWGYGGQSFGYDLYLVAPRDELSFAQLGVLAHELTHVRQFERDQNGGADFYARYCRGWVDGGFSYDDNVYEQEAKAYGGLVHEQLAPPFGLTPR